ncbi:AAA-like domain-containing protein, partial [Moorena sp. SIO3I6]|uniref:WD40 domain-containing protein n=1 Tax=Moorena sp. SIO3I6 TaxID=2607831 RepID=UPI0013F8BC7C
MTEPQSNYDYQVGGSLPVNATSYVRRQADEDFYLCLKAGQFCYVLNSRQMGKSSLRVRTMKRLQAEGILCGFIDLTGIGKEDVTPEKWYAGIVNALVSSCQLSKQLKWRSWWREQRDLLSPVQRLSLFIEEVLLVLVEHRIVIFVDEIDRVLSQNFSVDDFFALIRFFYNQRVDNPAYQRLTFALLGVATPSDLITDKTQTPFNIGKAIELRGFQLPETQPLAQGLEGKVDHPQAVVQELLNWTGGQPFLTQKLCQLVAQSADSRSILSAQSIEQIVQRRIIENWEAQDEPEHLRTIRERILRNQQRVGQLLGVYQQILEQGEIVADGSSEQTELRLSGLVVQQQGKLKVYNRIYEQIFNIEWVEKQLEKLRPYSEDFKAWVSSNYQDESRLLRGQALQEALSWSNTKSLSDLDYRFLATSQDLEKQEVEHALALKQEESRILSQANETLTLAQQQAQAQLKQAQRKSRRIVNIGSTILAISLVTAASVGLQVRQARRQLLEADVLLSSVSSKRAFESSPFEALLTALPAAQKLQALAESGSVKDYTRLQVRSALQQAIYGIRERNQIEGHRFGVRDVKYSPDGKLLASASEDRTVKLWNVETGTLLQTLEGHRGKLWSVNFSPDGRLLASSSEDGTVRIWRVADGSEVQILEGHSNWVRSVSFSPDGQTLASGSSDKTVKLWKVADGTEVQTIEEHRNAVTSVSFSPDGKTLASASWDDTVKLWNLENGKLIQTLKGHRHNVRSVSFSPNGTTLASTSEDNTIKLWSVANGTLLQTLEGHRSPVWSVSFNPNGRILASAGSDNIVKLWNLEDLKDLEPATIEPQTLRGHRSRIWSVSFSPDGQTLASASADSTVKLWALNSTEPQTLEAHGGDVKNVSFSPDGKLLAFASSDNTVKLWQVEDGIVLYTLEGHGSSVRSVSFSPDGKLLASGSSDKTVKLWQVEDGKLLQTLEGHRSLVRSVSFSPVSLASPEGVGRILASASSDKTVKLWQVEDGTLLQTLDHSLSEANSPLGYLAVTSISFSPNGKTIASASSDGNVRLWNVENGTLVQTLEAHSSWTKSVSFSPNGKSLASGGDDTIVKLWNLETSEAQTLNSHLDNLTSLSFSPDGKILASASNDRTVKLWKVADGTLLQTLEGHSGRVNSISFSPDGKTLASASEDNTLKLWNLDLDLDDLIRLGCDWLTNYLATHP